NLFTLAVYIENANHVHFNTSWGKSDLSFPRGFYLDRLSVMNKYDQQLIAQTYFIAFFNKVFKEDSSYDSLFQNSEAKKVWLPETSIISQYRSSAYKPIEQFNRLDQLSGVLNGFDTIEITTPKSRSGKNHPQNALELSWKNE